MQGQKRVKVAIIGIGGYGTIILQFLNQISPEKYVIAAADPYAKQAENYDNLIKMGVAIYSSQKELYEKHKVDLTIIASPIALHKEQVILAFEHGSHVMCEKPLVPTVQDAMELDTLQKQYKRMLAVGFQWSFSPTMLALKKDIQMGNLGKPLSLRSFIPWKRYDEYYNDSWKGRLYGTGGNWMLDCVVTNATAHYLHNMLFLMGEKMDEAALPVELFSSAYRFKEIETFDTCFLKGTFKNGCDMYFCASHSTDIDDTPQVIYEFEDGRVYMNRYDRESQVVLHRRDGTLKIYGKPQSIEEGAYKVKTMIDYCLEPQTSVPCVLKTILPHLQICNSMFDDAPIYSLETSRAFKEENPAGSFIWKLYDEMHACYESSILPFSAKMPWAKEEIQIHPENMTQFTGKLFI